MEEEDHQEMQLLSYTTTTPHYASSSSHPPPWPARFPGPSLDLQLSISVSPFKPPSSSDCVVNIREVGRGYGNIGSSGNNISVEALKWEAAEQIRLAAMEKAYAEHMMEMTRREMELAQSEFLRARCLWERAREEVERAEKMREKANSACMENITCLSCRQKFRPSS
ncbi:SHOOT GRAVITROPISM-like protein [Perilla frutescens var. hirtella]|nr:SHOOT GRAVITROPISM-like protein [Perilla frutescens var. hirtella]